MFDCVNVVKSDYSADSTSEAAEEALHQLSPSSFASSLSVTPAGPGPRSGNSCTNEQL